MLNFIRTVKIPTWAICYLANGDMSGLTDEEVRMADKWLESLCYDGVYLDFGDGAFNAPFPSCLYEFGCPDNHPGINGIVKQLCDVQQVAIYAQTNEQPSEYMGFVKPFFENSELIIVEGLHFTDSELAEDWMNWRYGSEGDTFAVLRDKVKYVKQQKQTI